MQFGIRHLLSVFISLPVINKIHMAAEIITKEDLELLATN
jgi:hypothetical protein